jgi:hypothetical protein
MPWFITYKLCDMSICPITIPWVKKITLIYILYIYFQILNIDWTIYLSSINLSNFCFAKDIRPSTSSFERLKFSMLNA